MSGKMIMMKIKINQGLLFHIPRMLERHDKNDTHLSKIKKVMPKTKDG